MSRCRDKYHRCDLPQGPAALWPRRNRSTRSSRWVCFSDSNVIQGSASSTIARHRSRCASSCEWASSSRQAATSAACSLEYSADDSDFFHFARRAHDSTTAVHRRHKSLTCDSLFCCRRPIIRLPHVACLNHRTGGGRIATEFSSLRYVQLRDCGCYRPTIICSNIRAMSNTAGPIITTNRAGKINKTVGNTSLTDAFCARSSASCRLFSRSESA